MDWNVTTTTTTECVTMRFLSRPDADGKRMEGKQTFDTVDEAISTFRKWEGRELISLTKTVSTTIDVTERMSDPVNSYDLWEQREKAGAAPPETTDVIGGAPHEIFLGLMNDVIKEINATPLNADPKLIESLRLVGAADKFMRMFRLNSSVSDPLSKARFDLFNDIHAARVAIERRPETSAYEVGQLSMGIVMFLKAIPAETMTEEQSGMAAALKAQLDVVRRMLRGD